jgi:acetyl-CoA carboxylase biotin carboxyl carrier protein
LSERKPGKRGASKSGKGTPPAAASRGGASGPMDVNLLQQIVELMSANDLNTVDLRDGEKRVVLKRGAEFVQYTGAPVQMSAPPPTGAAQPQPSTGSAGASAASAAEAADAKLVPIKSPMVGTFYAAPKQGEKPYVTVGSAVNEETDVCIIEAMKVFNVIKAETSGTIARVMIQDGQPVEHGTVLFLVKP